MENAPSPPGSMRTCPACKRPVEPGHKFCPICGEKVPELPLCRKCGAQFIAPVKFCELCGTSVDFPGNAGEVEEEPEVANHEPEAAPVYEPVPVPTPELRQKPVVVAEPEPVPVYEEEEPEEPLPVTPQPPPAKKKVVSSLPDELSILDNPTMDDHPPAPRTATRRNAGSSRTMIMVAGGIVILLAIAAAVYFVGLPMLKGSTEPPLVTSPQPPAAPVATQSPKPAAPPASAPPTPAKTPVPTTAPPAPEDPMVPVPTQTMIASQEVFFDVQKDQVTADISIIYQRGPGENVLNYAEVRVTRPDGTVKTGIIKPSNGDTELIITGSTGVDRVEVIAHLHNGQAYRIKDELKAFQPLREY